MNAQEAIEIIEKQITEIEELIYDRVNLEEGGYISFNQRIVEQKELTDLKEALSIVLESAKLLHDLIKHDGVDSLNADIYPLARHIYFDGEGILTIKSDVLEKVGIEVSDAEN